MDLYIIKENYKQFDSRWAQDIMKPGTDTLRRSGCFLTTIANILASAGKSINGIKVDPKSLNQFAIKNNLYNSKSMLDAPGLLKCFGMSIESKTLNSNFDAAKIQCVKDSLKEGYVIGKTSNHFINITDCNSKGDLTVCDPGYSVPKIYKIKDLELRVVKENGNSSGDNKGKGSADKDKPNFKERFEKLTENAGFKIGNSVGFAIGNSIGDVIEGKKTLLEGGKDAAKNLLIGSIVNKIAPPGLMVGIAVHSTISTILRKDLTNNQKFKEISKQTVETAISIGCSYVGIYAGASLGASLGVVGGPIGIAVGAAGGIVGGLLCHSTKKFFNWLFSW